MKESYKFPDKKDVELGIGIGGALLGILGLGVLVGEKIYRSAQETWKEKIDLIQSKNEVKTK
jgi:hypothetical protein